MATVYDAIYLLRYENTGLRNRVIVGVARAALEVLAEPANTANHTQRVAWAQRVLVNTAEAAERLMWAVVSDATIRQKANNATDGEVQAAVNGAIDTFALAEAQTQAV